MAVMDPETVVRVNWVKSCWRDERLVAAVAAAAVIDDEPPMCNGDIKFGALILKSLTYFIYLQQTTVSKYLFEAFGLF
jgi:hypothetical protein